MAFLVAVLKSLVRLTAGMAGIGPLAMVGVTTVDVILRKLGHPIPGAYEIVKMAAGVTIACALPTQQR